MTIETITPSYSVSGPLTDQELYELKAHGVTTLVNVRPDDEVENQTNHRQWRNKVREMGMEYVFVPVVSGHYSLADITDFYDLVTDPKRKVHGFCRTGTRAFHLWALAQAATQPLSTIHTQCESCGFDLTSISQQMQFLHEQRPWEAMHI